MNAPTAKHPVITVEKTLPGKTPSTHWFNVEACRATFITEAGTKLIYDPQGTWIQSSGLPGDFIVVRRIIDEEGGDHHAWFAFWEEGSFSPILTIVRQKNLEDAHSDYIETLPVADTDGLDENEEDPDGYQRNSSGELVYTELIQGGAVKLLSIECIREA